MWLWHTNGSPNFGQKTRPIIIKRKKRTYKIEDFAVPADHRIKLKENEKKNKYRNHARELKKLWNMKVTIISILICAFGTVTKGLLKGLADLEIRARVDTIKTTTLLRRPEYWEKSRRLEEICCHPNSSERPSAKTNMKNSQGVNYNNMWH